ncbi:MAG: hypothetical protein KKB39_02570 [Nanoarchaeota archaeon]|nr:hypothetical protein [Nanoarchaeota archaeon]
MKKRGNNLKHNNNVIELAKGKPRKEEEKFFITFSDTQLTAVLLLILADTFLVQGVIRYLESLGKISLIKPWLIMVLLSLFFLVTCVVVLTIGGIVSPLKYKRKLNMISFISFILGVLLFLASLFLIIVLI